MMNLDVELNCRSVFLLMGRVTLLSLQCVARFLAGYILGEAQTTRNVYWSHASVCLSVCLSLAACPHYCTDPDVT